MIPEMIADFLKVFGPWSVTVTDVLLSIGEIFCEMS